MCPPLNLGRLSWIQTQLDKRYGETVSTESVRKWLSGLGRPRHDKVEKLAELLKVDPSWLNFGTTPDDDMKRVGATQNAAVNLVSGIMLAQGVPVAIPDDNDPMGNAVNLYAVIGGRNLRIYATFGTVKGETVRFYAPIEFEHVNVVLVVPTESEMAFRLFHVLPSAISKYGHKRGGFIEMAGSIGTSVAVRDVDCPEIKHVKSAL
nr:helix-turn-helix transcriptional regulator [Jiella sonneratiae]